MRKMPVLLVALTALVACEAPVKHTGKRPMGRIRELVDARGESLEESAKNRTAPTDARTGEDVDETLQRVGVAETHLFHRGECARLKGVARGSRVLFVDAYDALDGGYAPCEHCRALR